MRDLPEGDSIPRLSWGHGNPQQVLAGVWAAKWEAGTEVRWAAEQEAGAEVSQAGKSQKKGSRGTRAGKEYGRITHL